MGTHQTTRKLGNWWISRQLSVSSLWSTTVTPAFPSYKPRSHGLPPAPWSKVGGVSDLFALTWL